MAEWTKDKEKRVLFKYRFTLSLKIIRIIVALLFLWFLYTMVVNIVYDQKNIATKNAFYSGVALEWGNPNLKTDDIFPRVTNEISTFMTQEISYPVYRTVGKENLLVGEMNLRKPLLSSFSHGSLKLNHAKYASENNFQFYLPEDPESGNPLESSEMPGVWATLEKVEEGTVADLAFSTNKYMTPEQIISLLKSFDVHITWMPIYSGEMKTFDSGWGGSSNSMSVAPLGLVGGKSTEANFRSGHGWNELTEESIVESKQQMLTHMEYFLENEKRNYYESALGLYHLEERYDYLRENGFQVYGAVVTGPVKELLKLKEVAEIRGAQIGQLEYWNWDNY